MRLKAILPFVAIAVSLCACETLTPQEQRARDEQTCSSYGFRHSTDNFANCLMRLDLDRRADYRSFRDSQDDDFFWGGPTVIVGSGYGYGGHRHWH
jgi:hypothetical protein